MCQHNYDYLKSFKKDDLINFYIQKDKQLIELKKELDKQKQFVEDKIKDMEERHEKQKYREWKQHIDTRYLDRYIREWLGEHLRANMEFGYDGCDSKELRGGIYIDDKKISDIQSYL